MLPPAIHHAVVLNLDGRTACFPSPVSLIAIGMLCCPGPAHADGYNDWSGELADPGALYLVPAVQIAPLDGPSAYLQFQTQTGLHERLDLLVAVAGWLQGGDLSGDGIYVQPRWQYADNHLVSLGYFLPLASGGDPPTLVPGLFSTFWIVPGRYKLNLNLTAYVPLRDASSSEHFSVLVLQRRLDASLAAYVETDLHGPLDDPGRGFDLLFGVQWDASDDDSFNLALLIPDLAARPNTDW